MAAPAPWERDYDHLFKLLVVGDSGVGKSAAVSTLCGEEFDANSISTIGVDFRIKHLDLDGKRVKLQIWDTAGQDRFRAVTRSYYRGAQGVLLCFDTTSPDSVSSLENHWLKEVARLASGDANLLLVGTKSDLAPANGGDARKRALELSEREDRLSAAPVLTSAKTGENIEHAMEVMVRNMLGTHATLKCDGAARRGFSGRELRDPARRGSCPCVVS